MYLSYYDSSLCWTGGVTSNGAIPNQACQWTPVANQAVWEEHIKPNYEQLKTGVMSVPFATVPDDTWLSRFRDTYYGNFVTSDAPTVPSATVHGMRRFKPDSKFKEWKKARDNGEVVLRPYHNAKWTVHADPGAPLSETWAHAGVSTLAHRMAGDLSETVPSFCASYPVVRQYGQYGLRTQNMLGTIQRYKWRGVSTANYKLPMSHSELLYLGELVDHRMAESELDTCLTTSTVASQRAGAVDVLTAFAEAPETINSIWDACKAILRYYLEVRKKVKRLEGVSDPGAIEAIANLWLQYRYAILPNVYLIEDALAYLDQNSRIFQTERQGERHIQSGFEYNGWTVPDFEVVHRCFMKTGYKAGFQLRDLQSWGPTTAWELVPLSFVVDWVIGVGDFLTALRPAEGVHSEGIQYSLKSDVILTLDNPDWVGNPIRIQYEGYANRVIDALDIGLTVSPDISWKRWLDAAALSWSSFRKLFSTAQRSLRK